MNVKTHYFGNQYDTVKRVVEICRSYRGHRVFNSAKKKSIPKIYPSVVRRYKKENGEELRHPRIFWRDGGDCDCQAIFWISYLLNCPGVKNVYVVEAWWKNGKSNLPGHMMVAFDDLTGKRYFIDSLPGSRLFADPLKRYSKIRLTKV